MCVNLTDDERLRFAVWLENSAKSDIGIAEQAEKLGSHGAIIAKKNRTRALAYQIVAKDLRSIQEQTF